MGFTYLTIDLIQPNLTGDLSLHNHCGCILTYCIFLSYIRCSVVVLFSNCERFLVRSGALTVEQIESCCCVVFGMMARTGPCSFTPVIKSLQPTSSVRL